jgi:hypothetical protein
MELLAHSPKLLQADAIRMRKRLEIEVIAPELDRPVAQVAQTFAEIDSQLRDGAQVTDFLPVLVA